MTNSAPSDGSLSRPRASRSSKIEQVDAATLDFARKLAGSRANESATSMVAATRALTGMVSAAGQSGRYRTRPDHGGIETLMHLTIRGRRGTPGGFGTCRTGSSVATTLPPRCGTHSPTAGDRRGLHGRSCCTMPTGDDVPPLVQAAVVHARVRVDPPFTVAGTGRIGRALINAVRRRRERPGDRSCRSRPRWWPIVR